MKNLLKSGIYAAFIIIAAASLRINAFAEDPRGIEIICPDNGFSIEPIWNATEHIYDMYLSRENTAKLINNENTEQTIRIEFVSSDNIPVAAFITANEVKKVGLLEFVMEPNSEYDLTLDLVCMPNEPLSGDTELGALSITVVIGTEIIEPRLEPENDIKTGETDNTEEKFAENSASYLPHENGTVKPENNDAPVESTTNPDISAETSTDTNTQTETPVNTDMQNETLLGSEKPDEPETEQTDAPEEDTIPGNPVTEMEAFPKPDNGGFE